MKTLPVKPALSFKYVDDEGRKMFSMRLPNALMDEIDRIAKVKGWSRTEVFQFALDQFCQAEKKAR